MVVMVVVVVVAFLTVLAEIEIEIKISNGGGEEEEGGIVVSTVRWCPSPSPSLQVLPVPQSPVRFLALVPGPGSVL